MAGGWNLYNKNKKRAIHLTLFWIIIIALWLCLSLLFPELLGNSKFKHKENNKEVNDKKTTQ